MSSSLQPMLWSAQSHAYILVTYLPFVFRLAALLTAFPFALFIALDAIAYGIARTLHLSMTQSRVPRSPLSTSSRPLQAGDSAYGEIETSYAFDIPTPLDTDDEEYDLTELSDRLDRLPSTPDQSWSSPLPNLNQSSPPYSGTDPSTDRTSLSDRPAFTLAPPLS